MLGGPDNPGFIQRAVSQIFESIPTFLEKDFLLRVSYMEIYNEQVTDLLSQVWDLRYLKLLVFLVY